MGVSPMPKVHLRFGNKAESGAKSAQSGPDDQAPSTPLHPFLYERMLPPMPMAEKSSTGLTGSETEDWLKLGLGLLAAGGIAYGIKKLLSEPSSTPAKSVPPAAKPAPKPVPIPTREANGPLPVHPFLPRMADPQVVTSLLQGNYDGLTEMDRKSLLERPLTINDFAESPEALKTLFLPGRTLSAQKQAALQTLEDPERFTAVMNGTDTAQVRETQAALMQDPLIFHDLLEKPPVLSNLYGWLAERGEWGLKTVTQQMADALKAVEEKNPSIFAPEEQASSAAPLDPKKGTFTILKKMEEYIQVLNHDMQYLESPQARVEFEQAYRQDFQEEQRSKGFFGRMFAVDDSAERAEQAIRSELHRMELILKQFIQYYPLIEKEETEFEMLRLMQVLTQIYGGRITQGFHTAQQDPDSVFETLFGPRENLRLSKHPDATKIVLFQGSKWAERPKKAKLHYKEPPRPEALQTVLTASMTGAFAAGLFGGFAGMGLALLNSAYSTASKWITGQPRIVHRREAWVEDVIGNSMVSDLLDDYGVTLENRDTTTLSEAATKVASSGFYNKLLLSIFRKEWISNQIQKLAGKLAAPPAYNPIMHVSHLSGNNPTFKTLVQGIVQNHNNTSIIERLSTVKQWMAKAIPASMIGWLNQTIGPILRKADGWVDHMSGLLHHVPFLDHTLNIIGHIPLKAELLTSSLSYSYNMITGLGTMALLDTAKKNGNRLPEEVAPQFNQANSYRTLRLYIQNIWQQIDAQPLREASDAH